MKLYVWMMLAALSVAPVQAGDDAAIYGPDLPSNAAFVRIIDVLGEAEVPVSVEGAPLTTGVAGATGYEVVTSGNLTIASGSNQAVVSVVAGHVYSIALSNVSGAQPTVFEDVISEDPSKSMIALYNLSQEPVSVAALAERVPVLEITAAGGSAIRAVNSVVIDLYVEGSTTTIQAFPQFALQPKTIASFFVFGGAGNLRVTNTVERTNK